MTAPRVLTFGCRLNEYESQAMQALAARAGAQDAILVNTCAVTAEAERQARKAIRRAHRENPGHRIIVTGCAAQIAPDSWAALPGVTRVLANDTKLRPESWGLPPEAPTPHPAIETRSRARAFLQIQQGCDHDCTFCTIPAGRGAAASIAPEQLLAQLRALVEAGYREVVLTGVDLTSYGADLPGAPSLGQVLRRLLAAVPELPRLRLSSLDPVEIDADLWRLLEEEPRLMPHLHLSIQHGATLILKRMKRRHDRAAALEAAARARRLRPDIALGADLIAGFPTETEAHFSETLSLVEEAGLSFLHVFPYSERPGTPAARMPQLPPALRSERAARLRAAGAAAAARFYRGRIGATETVLLEAESRGHTEHFAPLRLLRGAGARGALLRARVTGADADGLLAEEI